MSNIQSNKFPKTRYQGSKYKLSGWIKNILENLNFETCLDVFSGTSAVAYIMKEMGKTVYTNDFLKCNYNVAKSLIENNTTTINENDIKWVLEKHQGFAYDDFIEREFEDIYYTKEEDRWLDIVIQNILRIKDEYKQPMFLWALYQSAISKRPYNLFHRKNLYVRMSDVKRSFGNKSTWDKPFEEHFRSFINEINNSIFNNQKNNKSFCKDVFDVEIEADLVYIDPPYIPVKGSLIKYRDFYHFLDGLTDYYNWGRKIDYNSKHKKLLPEYNIWEDRKNIKNAFEKLVQKYQKSTIVISYREDGVPSIDDIVFMMEKYSKRVQIHKIDYKYVLSKKQNLKEVLIVGS